MPRSRTAFGVSLLTGFFLLVALFGVFLYALTPTAPAVRGPILLTAFILILIGILLCILFFLRWLLRPYRQLVGEAERAPVAAHTAKSSDEAQFVLETFQSVVSQLQSQQKELERLSAQESQRADSAERFSERIVASVPSALIALDGSGKPIVINARARELLEVDRPALDQPAAALLSNLPHLADLVEKCLRTGSVFRREEIEAHSENGTRRLGATIAPIELSAERGPRGVLCLLTDITEVTQLREQVSLKRNLESLGEMSAGLAHEFKNAIATLHGYAQLLQNLEIDERGRTAATSMLNEVRNLSDMVTAFLNFARPQPLELEEVLLDELIGECVVELGPLYEARGVEATVTTVSLKIDADERMLRQAFLNLLRNAAEAIPEDKSDRRVVVTARSESGAGREAALVEIKDTGTGIPSTDLQRIFIPFFTTKREGHGVGLALAHRVITEHGGTLAAANTGDGGAIFTIRLPLPPMASS